jgi:hypothetical protein
MKRRERAEMVVAWLESEIERGVEVTKETVELAIRRNSMNPDEEQALHQETMRVLRSKGYNVSAAEAALPVYGSWVALGAAMTVVWILVVVILVSVI